MFWLLYILYILVYWSWADFKTSNCRCFSLTAKNCLDEKHRFSSVFGHVMMSAGRQICGGIGHLYHKKQLLSSSRGSSVKVVYYQWVFYFISPVFFLSSLEMWLVRKFTFKTAKFLICYQLVYYSLRLENRGSDCCGSSAGCQQVKPPSCQLLPVIMMPCRQTHN